MAYKNNIYGIYWRTILVVWRTYIAFRRCFEGFYPLQLGALV